jgi:hypothetical protein
MTRRKKSYCQNNSKFHARERLGILFGKYAPKNTYLQHMLSSALVLIILIMFFLVPLNMSQISCNVFRMHSPEFFFSLIAKHTLSLSSNTFTGSPCTAEYDSSLPQKPIKPSLQTPLTNLLHFFTNTNLFAPSAPQTSNILFSLHLAFTLASAPFAALLLQFGMQDLFKSAPPPIWIPSNGT